MQNINDESKKCRRQFMENNRITFVITLILQIIVVAVNISLAYFIMFIVDAMQKTDLALFKRSMIFIVIVLVVFLVFSTLLKIFKNSYMKRALSQFKKYVFEKILKKSIGEFSGALSGKIISSFSNDLSLIELNYLNGNIMIFNNAVMFIATLAAMAYINMTMMLCVVGGCIIPVTVSLIYGRRLVTKEKKTSDENESFVDQLKDLLNGFFVIKSFKAEKEVLELFRNQNFTLEETKRDRRETNDAMFIAGQISSLLVVGIIFILGIYFTFKGVMSIASVLACVQLSNYILDPIKQLVPLISNRKAAIALIDKIADVIKDEDIKDDKIRINGIKSSITLKDVALSYDEGKVVLDGINMTFEKGKSYAIVGGSGCGKSTLIKLLLGYFNNYGGEVKLDENELSDINLDSLYDVVSVIQQNVFLFDKSIKSNITMFKEFDKDKMERAISRAGLSNLISEKGENYNCGESGHNLSGGEKQRVSIARCLIRETPVLLMDEATAALDNATAFQVENEILDMKELTRIIVTHKLEESLLRKYDEIVVMHEGTIEEKGTFEQLMEAGGYFYSLFNVAKAS